MEVVRLLLEAAANPNKEGTAGEGTPLCAASARGGAEIVRLLLGVAADIEACNRFGFTPLCLAASAGNVEVARLLVDARADVNALNPHAYAWQVTLGDYWKSTETPLTGASSHGHVDIVHMLLEARADPGETARSAAGRSGHYDIVNLLDCATVQNAVAGASATDEGLCVERAACSEKPKA